MRDTEGLPKESMWERLMRINQGMKKGNRRLDELYRDVREGYAENYGEPEVEKAVIDQPGRVEDKEYLGYKQYNPTEADAPGTVDESGDMRTAGAKFDRDAFVKQWEPLKKMFEEMLNAEISGLKERLADQEVKKADKVETSQALREPSEENMTAQEMRMKNLRKSPLRDRLKKVMGGE